MKIQIDTIEKVIKLEDKVNIKDLTDMLKTLLPKGLWKEYSIDTNTTVINWSYPTTINPYNPYPTYPWISYNLVEGNEGVHTIEGIYNVEV